MIDGSFSISIVLLAQEQVIAEQRNTLMINMTKNRIPNVMQSGHTQSGDEEQSVQTDSTSEKNKVKIKKKLFHASNFTQPQTHNV